MDCPLFNKEELLDPFSKLIVTGRVASFMAKMPRSKLL